MDGWIEMEWRRRGKTRREEERERKKERRERKKSKPRYEIIWIE